VPDERALAHAVALARLQYRIELGGCYAYALAKQRALPLLTLDPDFGKSDSELVGLG